MGIIAAFLLSWFLNAWAAKCPLNQNTKLKPPSGGWRGAVVDDRFGSVAAWEKAYGYKLHMKRVFKGFGYEDLTADETAFVKGGGILFYTIPMSPPTKFSDYFGGSGNNKVKRVAKVLKALSPAKVMVTMRYEPEFWTDKSDPTKYLGPTTDYVKMWGSFQDGFKSLGVTNVVWAMDYSSQACSEEHHPLIAALWPGDGKVDWLFWNLFQIGEHKGRSFDDMFQTAYNAFDKLSGKAQTYNGKTYKANYKGVQHWGLGAWGANQISGDDAYRSKTLEAAAAMFKSGKYPKMQAHAYFDTVAHNDNGGDMIDDGMKAAYKDLNGLYFFTQNDKCASDAVELADFDETMDMGAGNGDPQGKGTTIMLAAGLVLPGFLLLSAVLAYRRRAGAASDFQRLLAPDEA